jgi:hypothetical protein
MIERQLAFTAEFLANEAVMHHSQIEPMQVDEKLKRYQS